MPSFQPGGYVARVMGIPAVTHIRFPDSAVGYRWFLRSRFSRALFVSRALMTSAMNEAPEVQPVLRKDRPIQAHRPVEGLDRRGGRVRPEDRTRGVTRQLAYEDESDRRHRQ